ncbi:hypothetical protein PM082_018241 [Marasmius tenuissimus]|nr:hypothetical protein PM082_018241 [Marasmius tenuissimus]
MSSTFNYALTHSFSEDSCLITTITLAGKDSSLIPEFEVTTPPRRDNPTIVRKHGAEVGNFVGKAKEGCSVNGRVIERAKGSSMSFMFSDGKKYTWKIHQRRKKIDLRADETRAVIATFSSSAPKGKKPEVTPPALHISPPTGFESGMIDEIITTLFYVRQHGARGMSSSPRVFDLMSESY